MADVIVVGAGAAGLTAALRAAEQGAEVLLLNAHPRIGLKILMSGGTRCNVTHSEVSERDFRGGSRPFVARTLRAFTVEQTLQWMSGLGIDLKLEPTGKYFPVSNDAHTVLDGLRTAVEHAGVRIESGAHVTRLERAGDPPRYRIGVQSVTKSSAFGGVVSGYRERDWQLPVDGPGRWLESKTVILATGGLSFPRTGSDGTGYALAAALGHTIVPPVPALTPLAADDPLCGSAQGITLDTRLTMWKDRERVWSGTGSLLITHFGFSGPVALDLSRHWNRTGEQCERSVTANFCPPETREGIQREWLAAAGEKPGKTVKRFLADRMPARLADILCAEAGVETASLTSQVPREKRTLLLDKLTERPLAITGTLGFEKAECTAGGVQLSEVNPSTLASRVSPGLFLCGEILDVEGRLGGFNFQWAWSSGTVAGRAAARAASP
jgi:predicted flavoprotein YhiN